jgi:hypothetical protein
MSDDQLIPKSDAEAMLRLLSEVAEIQGPMPAKRYALMQGLVSLTHADAWGWIIARAVDEHHAPAVGCFLCGGMDDALIARYAQVMEDRSHPPVEYAALNQLRRTHNHFTKGWDELVTPERWYGPDNRHVIDGLGFEHVLYSVRVLDNDGYFSGISLKRKKGHPNFNLRERQITHMITGIVDWLHWDPKLATVTKEIQPLPPHLRTMLILLVDPRHPVVGIATQLGIKHSTAKEYAQNLYRHFAVKNRNELLGRFLIGDEDNKSLKSFPPSKDAGPSDQLIH